MRVEVSPNRAVASGRTPIVFRVTITNTTEVIGGYVLRVLGLDPAWVHTDQPQLSLFPAMSGVVTVTVTPPVGLPAGDQRFAIQVRELTPPYTTSINDVDLEIPAAPSVSLSIDPRTVTAGKTGAFGLLVENAGNTRLIGRLIGADEEDKIAYRFEPTEIDLPPGEHAAVELRVKARRKLLGQPNVRPFMIKVDDGQPVGEDDLRPRTAATFMQRPYLGRGAMSLVGLLAAVTIFALVITYALSNVVGRSAADRDLALQVAQAQAQGGVGGSGTAAGTVRQLTTGQPVQGVNVDLFAASDTATPLETSATDKGGAYSLTALAAGNYKVRFRGAGFADVWYPQSLTDADATPITVQEGQDLSGLDVRLGGLPATIAGKVIADSVNGANVSLEVPGTVQKASGTPATLVTQAAGAVLQTVPVGADGTFALANVPSPSVYDLVVSEPGFATTTERIDVAGGENRTGVQVPLRKGDGLISGNVSSLAGPILGATITATYNQTSVQTVSLSQGNVGTFTLRGLPTPATFSIVVSAQGFASQTLALSLTAGQQLTNVGVTLGGASGTLDGTVATAADKRPASGVTVTVTNGVVTLTTVTQTTGTPGAWQLEGLPVPSTYTLTFSRADLAAQTLSVALDAFGTATTQAAAGTTVSNKGIAVSMRSSTAEFRGQTVTGGVGVGEVLVTISSGAQTFSVTSATVPTTFGAADTLPARAGLFDFDRLPPGTYTVTVSRNHARPTSSIVTLAAGDISAVDNTLTLAAPVNICGVVRNASLAGSPGAKNVLVRLFRASNYPKVAAAETTTADGAGGSTIGRFCFNDVDAPENYILEVDYPTAGTPYLTKKVVVNSISPAEFDLIVKDGQ
ncbi:MAG: hypothetical protein QOF18_1985 [Frankiaceae bacterium]|nr:hypothetical protein [Frankiaceae bacterium]